MATFTPGDKEAKAGNNNNMRFDFSLVARQLLF